MVILLAFISWSGKHSKRVPPIVQCLIRWPLVLTQTRSPLDLFVCGEGGDEGINERVFKLFEKVE